MSDQKADGGRVMNYANASSVELLAEISRLREALKAAHGSINKLLDLIHDLCERPPEEILNLDIPVVEARDCLANIRAALGK